ncbi:SLC12A2 [Lepeophtheirus salmonis]|uniref:SLC12A2 n=1 Tax=Lepeophtheirus salmonis TaxID=72036 RepID=A0A7R8CK24_LEPSM|nr:SLC12A2 [Lepeophtheirus salmonis]CAF2846420.1 SLC12A2 [Lepeophtheirus salmonis]
MAHINWNEIPKDSLPCTPNLGYPGICIVRQFQPKHDPPIDLIMRPSSAPLSFRVSYVKMRKKKEDVLMIKTNVEARVNRIDHGYGQIQTNVEEARMMMKIIIMVEDKKNVVETRIEDENLKNSNEKDVSKKVVLEKNQNCPKVGGNFEAIDPNSGKWFQGKFIGRAGKANGRYKRLYNI